MIQWREQYHLPISSSYDGMTSVTIHSLERAGMGEKRPVGSEGKRVCGVKRDPA
jgi:hypothetical protein